MSDRIRAALQQLTELEGHTLVDCTADWAEAMIEARAALAESATSDYKVASEDTMRRIRSTTKRWRVSVIISTDDSSIDTRIGCGIWKCLDIEREILESVSLPEYLPAIKETTND